MDKTDELRDKQTRDAYFGRTMREVLDNVKSLFATTPSYKLKMMVTHDPCGGVDDDDGDWCGNSNCTGGYGANYLCDINVALVLNQRDISANWLALCNGLQHNQILCATGPLRGTKPMTEELQDG
ncbi:hypothetical protein ElyMa_005273900 [Elysia marginata]|uniref:Uncharacterized protein n=1 Tax=Elysia marginata TaxID=1093978 RepID=A0AAV4JXQ2_9GAST|nr:hypothetical protein ElyMa_005273900 [Elysia marginata]